jgi:hypothetical protein
LQYKVELKAQTSSQRVYIHSVLRLDRGVRVYQVVGVRLFLVLCKFALQCLASDWDNRVFLIMFLTERELEIGPSMIK